MTSTEQSAGDGRERRGAVVHFGQSALHVDGHQVDLQAISRSQLLQDGQATHGPAELALTSDAFCKWAQFSNALSGALSPEDLVQLLWVCSVDIWRTTSTCAVNMHSACLRATFATGCELES